MTPACRQTGSTDTYFRMDNLLDELKNRVLVADGAMGTILQKKGLKNGEIPESWNVSKSEIIKDIHKSYIDAGADIIITNTFGASKLKLERVGLSDKVEYFNKKGTEIALEASSNNVYVLGDLGPSGRFAKPYGDVEFEDLYINFKQQIFALKDTGIHGFIIETMSDINELNACILAVKDSTNLPLIASMTFQKINDNNFKTMMGVSVEDFVKKTVSKKCQIIGTNCGDGTNEMLDIVKEIKRVLESYEQKVFVLAQPNAGKPKFKNEKTYFDESPDKFKEIIPEYLEVGVNIIGGCCGTTPEHIEVIKKLVVASRRE